MTTDEWRKTMPMDMLTARDLFAALAMQGVCANSGGPIQANERTGWDFANSNVDEVARTAYALADAMMEARQS